MVGLNLCDVVLVQIQMLKTHNERKRFCRDPREVIAANIQASEIVAAGQKRRRVQRVKFVSIECQANQRHETSEGLTPQHRDVVQR